jgi:capsular polysaccharide export protein
MTPAAEPLLRSPPFPSVPRRTAAVSLADAAAAASLDAGDLLTAMREARVGGAFWAPQPNVPAGATIVVARDADATGSLPARAERPLFALLPQAGWAPGAARALAAAGIATAVGPVDPWALFDAAALVEAPGDDELILLALIAGVPARCTTPGRFAGHGLTLGETPALDVAAKLSMLVAATLERGVRYRNPFTGAAADARETIGRLAEWRRLIDANRAIAVAAGIAVWKRREVARLLWSGAAPPRFARTPGRALRLARAQQGAIAAWPSRVPASLPGRARATGTPLHRVEDGFIRSVGLGSNLHPPLSIVVDASGIYYDPTRPSDLETLLETAEFAPDLLERARALSAEIVRAGISKYSSGGSAAALDLPADRRIVLVAGQVEDDLSVRLGGGDVAGNLDLLRRARAAEPDAFLLFKPHPDVDAGHRAGRIVDGEALAHADRVVRDIAMPALLAAVDGVHVLTSLAGYEALLRGRDVTVHGSPFYAGWGLTRDLGPVLRRRTSRRSLDELTAAALILYPRYLDPQTGLPCPPEVLVARLAARPVPRQTALIRARRLQGWLRRVAVPIGRSA